MENPALRQQLAVQQKTISRPRLKHRDRQFWIWLSQLWPQWQSAPIIVKPETVIKWHRQVTNACKCGWKLAPIFPQV